MKLTSPSAVEGARASSVDTFGRFATVSAQDIVPGDKLAVLSDEANPSAGFTVVAVSSIQTIEEAGRYLPALERPWIIANGVVAPLWTNSKQLTAASEAEDGAKQAAQHYEYAPLWMQRLQPVGTAGVHATWNTTQRSAPATTGGARAAAANSTTPVWPGAAQIIAAKSPRNETGQALRFDKLRSWWLPRYQAWAQADPSSAKAITLSEVLNQLQAMDMWLLPKSQPISEQGTISLEREAQAGTPQLEAYRAKSGHV